MGWDGMGWDGMGWDGMGWESVKHLPGTRPDRPYASVACVAGCPTLDSERLKPPQTQSETGAVKFPTHTQTHTHTHHVNSWS